MAKGRVKISPRVGVWKRERERERAYANPSKQRKNKRQRRKSTETTSLHSSQFAVYTAVVVWWEERGDHGGAVRLGPF